MKIQFRVSTAGIAGDPYKLLVLEYKHLTLYRLFNSNYLFSLRRARRKLSKEFELLTGNKL